MVRNCTNMAPRAGAGILASLALIAIGAMAPSASGQCNVCAGADDASLGIVNFSIQECGDGQWAGFAFPIMTGGGLKDCVSVQLSENLGGGDMYIMGDIDCQPDTSNILASSCCALDPLPAGVVSEIRFPAVNTSAVDPTWVVFVERSGLTGVDEDGNFDGTGGASVRFARDGASPSLPNQAFGNLVGTGNPGDWTDLDDFDFGNCYQVTLLFAGGDPDIVDCGDHEGACCVFDGSCEEASHDFLCFTGEGNSYAGDGVDCAGANCEALCIYADANNDPPGPCGQPDAGPCAFGNGSPGCDDAVCCCLVCEVFEPLCCTDEWDALCADLATNPDFQLNCAPEPGVPSDLATGDDSTVDGYLRIGSDDFGSWADPGFGAGLGDTFNPVGGLAAGSPMFGAWFSVYRQAFGEAEALSTNSAINEDNLCPNDNSMTRAISSLSVSTDTNGDNVADTKVSTWDLTSMSGMDTSWQLTQHVFNDTPKGGPLVAIVEFEFLITNNGPPVDFILHRHLDIDSLFVTGNFADDNVGTGTNAAKSGSFVYQGELGFPEVHITLSSPQGDVYYGGKQGVIPDPGDPNCVAYDFGSDTEICENLGTPDCWKNHIAGVGYDTDGDSGPDVGADGFIGMEIPISLAAEGVTTVSVMMTYGAKTPGGGGDGEPCPWDLDGSGSVGAADLLDLLFNWGPCPGCAADFDGDDIVGASDLLAMLFNWGPCP